MLGRIADGPGGVAMSWVGRIDPSLCRSEAFKGGCGRIGGGLSSAVQLGY